MKIVYYRSSSEPAPTAKWYWRLVAGNGRTIADGAEGYSKKGNVLRACKKVQGLLIPQFNDRGELIGRVEIEEFKS